MRRDARPQTQPPRAPLRHRPSPMAASAASMASPQASRESGSSTNGTAARWRGGAEATMREAGHATGVHRPSEFTCKKRPRSFSMSTISGSIGRRGNDTISSSAGAGLHKPVASKRLNEVARTPQAADRRHPHWPRPRAAGCPRRTRIPHRASWAARCSGRVPM